MNPTDDHRRVYDLIVNQHPNGLSRDDLAAKSGLGDRKMRAVLEDLRIIAATKPHPRFGPLVLGFDPESERYVFARTREQAARIMAYQSSRVVSIAAALRAQEAAAKHLGYKTPEATQDALLIIERAPRWTA